MKRHLPLFILLFIVACTVNQAEPTPTPEMPVTTPTTVASPVPPATASLPATNTIPLPTDTATSQPIVTDTPPPTTESTVTPPLAEPTLEPTATPYSGPLPSGRLYFLWDPTLLPFSGWGDLVHNLYLYTPTNTPDQWDSEILLTELIGYPYITLSADKTKFALTKIVDANGDGFASQDGVNHGFDSYQLYFFDLITQNLGPLRSNISNPYDLGWLSDSQTVIFRDATGIHLQPVNGTTQKFQDVAPDRIASAKLSPDKQLMALNLQSAQIAFLNLNSGELFLTIDNGGFSAQATWSANSKWFILPQGSTQQLLLINIQEHSMTPIMSLETVRLMGWSPTGATLAIHQALPTSSQIILINPDNSTVTPVLELPPTDTFGALAWSPTGTTLALHQFSSTHSQIILVDPEDLSVTTLFDLPVTDNLIHLSWSPEGNSLLLATKHQQHVTLQIYDLATHSLRELWQADNLGLGRFNVMAWSPDAQWVLFIAGLFEFAAREDSAGLFLASPQTGQTYQLLDTSGAPDPHGFFWLP